MAEQTNTALDALIRAHLDVTPARVSRLEHSGVTLWVKRREALAGVRRLQKGDAAAAFERERNALHALKAKGAPVPRIIAEGVDYFATLDCGQPLSEMLATRQGPLADRIIAFHAAGQALAKLHAAGISHGRPNLKDICWKDGRITFIDLERYTPSRNTPKGHRQDLIMFVFNGGAVAGGVSEELRMAMQSYRAADTTGTWDRAARWCHWMRWIVPLTAPLRWLRKSAELDAIPLLFRAFAR